MKLRELQKSEEGQTLVLAALFGLVLMLCVLGTVNLGRAVYDKVQLQAAADAEAYSSAAIEARVMNFTAYTNRAMVVHYASVMAATSYLTWVHFIWAGLKPLLKVLTFIPYVGEIFAVIQQVFSVLVKVLDIALAIFSPLMCAANLLLYGLQEGAWGSVYLQLLKTIQPQAHSGDSAARPYTPIWPNILPTANATVFSQVRGHLTMPLNTLESLQVIYNAKSDAVQEARMHMLEVANSARQPWNAYGDKATWSPLARHSDLSIDLGFAGVGIGNISRTEMGGYAPKGGIIGGVQTAFPQVWSGQSLRFKGHILFFKWDVNLFSFVAMDQMYTPFPKYGEQSYYLLWSPPKILEKVVPGLGTTMKNIANSLNGQKPNPDYRVFFMSPYVYFAPRSHWQAGLGPTGALGNFAQPDVVSGLALEGRYMNREQGAAKYYGRRFAWNGGGAGSGSVDFSYTNADWPQVTGMPRNLQVLHKGLNAFSAAQVYYHRPGDWKEMPNLFNPLWGARLMPVLESSAAAKAGFTAVPTLKTFLLH